MHAAHNAALWFYAFYRYLDDRKQGLQVAGSFRLVKDQSAIRLTVRSAMRSLSSCRRTFSWASGASTVLWEIEGWMTRAGKGPRKPELPGA